MKRRRRRSSRRRMRRSRRKRRSRGRKVTRKRSGWEARPSCARSSTCPCLGATSCGDAATERSCGAGRAWTHTQACFAAFAPHSTAR
eukprot:4017151-Pyramimonas_sp.AAC.1